MRPHCDRGARTTAYSPTTPLQIPETEAAPELNGNGKDGMRERGDDVLIGADGFGHAGGLCVACMPAAFTSTRRGSSSLSLLLGELDDSVGQRFDRVGGHPNGADPDLGPCAHPAAS